MQTVDKKVYRLLAVCASISTSLFMILGGCGGAGSRHLPPPTAQIVAEVAQADTPQEAQVAINHVVEKVGINDGNPNTRYGTLPAVQPVLDTWNSQVVFEHENPGLGPTLQKAYEFIQSDSELGPAFTEPFASVLPVLQQQVNQAWFHPESPDSALLILAFGKGTVGVTPPVLTANTRLGAFSEQLFDAWASTEYIHNTRNECTTNCHDVYLSKICTCRLLWCDPFNQFCKKFGDTKCNILWDCDVHADLISRMDEAGCTNAEKTEILQIFAILEAKKNSTIKAITLVFHSCTTTCHDQ